jgi:hypothetical protein
MAFLAISISGCGDNKSSNKNPGSTDLASVLEALGISTSVEDRKDPNGNALRADYNPTGKKVSRINKNSEIYMAGSCIQGKTGSDTLFDPVDSSILSYDSDGAWTKSNYYKTVGADTNADGHDEIITVVFDVTNGKLILKETKYNKDSNTYTRKDVATITDPEITQTSIGYRIDAVGDIVSGDIDGDGKEEIIVAYLSNIVIFDDASASYKKLINKKITSVATSNQLLKVGTGDFDQDGKDEIVITNGIGIPNNNTTAQYTIYDDLVSDASMTNPIVSNQPITAYFSSGIVNQIDSPALTGTKSLEAAKIAVGDFNGDGLPDIAFAGNSSADNGCYLFILQTTMDKNSMPKFGFMPVVAYDSSYEYSAPPVAAGDINGDGIDDLVMWKGVYTINKTTGTLSLMGVTITATGKPIYDIKVGDIDGDYKCEIVILYNLDSIWVYEFDSASKISPAKTVPFYITSTNTLGWGTIALPSTKKTCEVIEYSGHEVKFTDPRIIAVIAAPPYHNFIDGKDRNTVQPYLGNIGTSFGKSKTKQAEKSDMFGFNVSFSWGASVSCPLWNSAATSTMKTTLSNSFNWTSTSSTEVTCSYSYTNGTDDDMVVFSVIPFDVYSYTVLNSSDPKVIGQTVTISLPKKPITTSQSVTFYNKNNGDYFDVNKDVLVHTIGNPFTYATSSAMAAIQDLKPNGLYIPTTYEQSVGEGTSGTTLSMQSAETKSKSFSYDLSITNDMEMVVVGVLVGRGIGFNYGYSYSTSVTDSTEIEGQVANLAADFYKTDSNKFTWGLMAYPYVDKASKQNFNVVTYWVDKFKTK